MGVAEMFKPKKKKKNSQYGWLPSETINDFEEIPAPIKQTVKTKTAVEDVDYASLVAEWNCFKYKMEAFIAQQKRR